MPDPLPPIDPILPPGLDPGPNAVAVPEPGSVWLALEGLGIALGASALLRRRKDNDRS